MINYVNGLLFKNDEKKQRKKPAQPPAALVGTRREARQPAARRPGREEWERRVK